ncbi:MAG: glycosyltransferase family 39 protein [Chlorogloeopsis fritschii C42_A2020_084]|uniref:ArnT family glycosyltransferase n=1 Tax=Chlorogloeopsis fritschii TaxID=1124 RepID=UPI0019E3A3A3|nr:glycosyltransferase family 39 protein [Chlorogloeopsis fritschii]MBF2005669.1 glycosyltransferase family 39 protein [Chlorogloeopsis fritschii C42_A2020_084]
MTIRAFNQFFKNIGKRPALTVALSILWLLVIGGVAFFWHLGSIGLIDETEPLFAEASRQMYLTGDWITPFFNGETRFDKPALIYWCQAIAYAIFGVNEWAVRLPSAIAAMGVISLTFYTVQWQLATEDVLEQVSRPTRRWLTASLAAAILALSPEMIVWARTGVSDMLLTGCIASALFCFFLGYARGNRGQGIGDREIHNTQYPVPSSQSLIPNKWYLAFYVLIAGAILTKGPVGIVLPGLIIGAFLLYLGKLPEVMREMKVLAGVLIIAGLSLPWYLLVIWRNGWNYINSFFGYHNIERFTEVVNGHAAPWYFYFVVVLLGFAPYSVYLPLAIARVKFWQRKYWLSQERSQQFRLFAFFWFVIIFGFFTIAVTKLPSYVLPLMPAAAILVALLWGDLLKDTGKFSTSPLFWSGWVNVVFVSAIAVALFYVPQLIGTDPAAPQFRQLLQQSGLSVLGGIIWLVCAVVLAVLILRRRWFPLMGVNLLGFAAFMIFVLTPALFLIDHERQLPLRELSAIAVQAHKPGEELIMVGFKKPTVVFYTQRSVNYIKMTAAAGDYIRKDATKKVQTDSVLVLAQPKKFPEMGLQPSNYQSLGKSGAYQLIRVPLNQQQNPN